MTTMMSRLSAWWEGEEPDSRDAAAEEENVELDVDESASGAGWPAPRLAAVQTLFGEGCTFPGSTSAITQLIEPLELDDSKTVVDIGAGIGTSGRVIAKEIGAAVLSLEADPAQNELARQFAEQAGLGAKVTTVEGILGDCDIEAGSQDAVFGREALLGVADKHKAFLDMWTLLKPGGQILLADYMAKTPAGVNDDAVEWGKFEKMKPHFVTVDDVKQGLSATHMDVHRMEDISPEFCSHILQGLAGLTDTLKKASIPRDQRPWVMWEVELWARRVMTLQAGNVGFFRFHASKAE